MPTQQALCRRQAARSAHPHRPDAEGFRREARRLPALSQPDGEQQPPRLHRRRPGLAREFGLDVTELGSGDTERLVSDMREAIADPVFADTAPPLTDLRLAASNAPALARAFLDLHRAYRQTHERLASLDEALGRRTGGGTLHSPWEEVRDFFHYCDNYIDAVDRAAEHFAGQAEGRSRRPYRGRAQAERRHAEEGRGRRRAPLRPGDAHADPLAPRRARDAALPASAPIRASGAGPASGGHARPRPVPDRYRARDRAHRHGQLLRRRRSDALYPLRRGRPRHPPRPRTALDPVRRLDRAGGPPALDPAAPGRQGRALLLRARRSGGHRHQAPLRHAAAIRPLRRRLPLVERAPRLRDAGPLPAPAGRNPGRCAYT
jgi:hypothetical protein